MCGYQRICTLTVKIFVTKISASIQLCWRFKPSPVSLAPFLTFHFRCLELVLAAITVARGRSQSVLCVGHSCGPGCLASLMSASAWLKIILAFSRIGVAEEPSFSDGLCMHRDKRGFLFG